MVGGCPTGSRPALRSSARVLIVGALCWASQAGAVDTDKYAWIDTFSDGTGIGSQTGITVFTGYAQAAASDATMTSACIDLTGAAITQWSFADVVT